MTKVSMNRDEIRVKPIVVDPVLPVDVPLLEEPAAEVTIFGRVGERHGDRLFELVEDRLRLGVEERLRGVGPRGGTVLALLLGDPLDGRDRRDVDETVIHRVVQAELI